MCTRPRAELGRRADGEDFSMNELSDKVAIITGGGYGIGKQIALKYGGVGAKVVLAARSLDPMKETCGELEKIGAKAIFVQCVRRER